MKFGYTILFVTFLLMTQYVCRAEGVWSSLSELRQQAEQGNPSAQYHLGKLYAAPVSAIPQPASSGVRPKYPFLEWVERFNRQNPTLTPLESSEAYLHRYGPPPAEEIESQETFVERVRSQNPNLSEFDIGEFYDRTYGVAQRAYNAHLKSQNGGLPQDYVQARKLFFKAAEQGHAAAQYNLGKLYAEGRGIPQDDIEAYAWANIAAAQGDSTAIGLRNRLRKKLDSDSLSKAQALSKKYYEKYVVPFQ